MVDKRNTFVFVVCGAKAYTDTLNIAISYLKAFSKSHITVITDSSRNEGKIQCDHIIDIKTDPALNHHQASVFLKTSIHRYLDLEAGRYCYLDSDVLAITDKVDEIFNEKPEIIGFCNDNITLDLFSPYAVNCGCYESARENEQKLISAQNKYDEKLKSWKEFVEKQKGYVLINLIAATKKSWLKNLFPLISFTLQKTLPFHKSASLKGYKYDKKTKYWKNAMGDNVLYPIESYYDFISGETGFNFDYSQQFWYKDARQDVCIPRCTHLHQTIKQDHGITISPDKWQHWNGGVFLFDKNSVEFLEFWHKTTMDIFQKPSWKTRDQGTLALAAWKFSLQNQPALNNRFNYILDYFKPGLGFNKEKGFTKDDFITNSHPEFVHVYHRFGDENWDIWQHLLNVGKEKGIYAHE
jgi:hypothetical protein